MSEVLNVEELAPHQTLQYASRDHQSATALAGMWLFLASEVLFFGALFLSFGWLRLQHPSGYAAAARHTNLWIGTANTVVLVTSSAVFAAGAVMHERHSRRWLERAMLLALALGVAFVVLKGIEWSEDFSASLVPVNDFALRGADEGGARQFFFLYFAATGLHGLHMLVGLGLLLLLLLWSRRGRLDDRGDGQPWTTPVEVIGLYWSFVDMVWLVLFPLIYVLGRAT